MTQYSFLMRFNLQSLYMVHEEGNEGKKLSNVKPYNVCIIMYKNLVRCDNIVMYMHVRERNGA